MRATSRPILQSAVMAVALLVHPWPAVAEPSNLVTAPPRWRADPEQASALAQRFAAIRHFGGLPAATATQAYVAERPGVALFATRATADLPGEPARAAGVVRAALDELRASARGGALAGGALHEDSWREGAEAEPAQITAALAASDPASHVALTARVVVASDGKRIVAVTGECLANDAAAGAAIAACQAALATLDTGLPKRGRVALTAAPSGEASAPAAAPEPPPRTPARLDDGSHITFPPMTIAQEPRATDDRPVYVGAGVIALAVMFWWNRQRRDRLEREEREREGRPLRTAARRRRDDDAEDLQAAARGEPPPQDDRRDNP